MREVWIIIGHRKLILWSRHRIYLWRWQNWSLFVGDGNFYSPMMLIDMLSIHCYTQNVKLNVCTILFLYFIYIVILYLCEANLSNWRCTILYFSLFLSLSLSVYIQAYVYCFAVALCRFVTIYTLLWLEVISITEELLNYKSPC